ncbi:MAG: alpha/beta hydrolase [Ferrimicrobium sp.]
MGELDPVVAQLLARFGAGGFEPVNTVPLAQARAGLDLICQIGIANAEVMDRVEDRVVESVPIRVYWPFPVSECEAVVVFFHGGGFVLGSLNGYDRLARRIALGVRAIVISVDYRLAPEHPYPAAIDDADAVWRWLQSSDFGELPRVVGGDSAGGNLAAVVALGARDRGERLDAQLLWYPAVDFDENAPSMLAFAQGYFMTREEVIWFGHQYLVDEDRQGEWRVNPSMASDFSGVAPAEIVVAGFDPLRDFGVRYGERLRADGVPTTVTEASSLIHGFAMITDLVPEARREIDDSLARLRALVGLA